MDDLYSILGMNKNADFGTIKTAFRDIAKLYHPDTNNGSTDFLERYNCARSAYEILSDTNLRRSYDEKEKSRLADEKKEKTRRDIQDLDDATRIEIILAWATTKRSFNSSFVASCLDRMAEGRELSPRQRESIENILVSFAIDIYTWIDEDKRQDAINKFWTETIPKKDAFEAFNSDCS